MNTVFELIALLLAAGMFLGMLAVIEVGRRLGAARLAKNPDGLAKGIGASEGAVFGLLGLLIAFTFSGAATRFEARRHLVTEETNAIGTAYLRIDVVPEEARPELQSLFRRYVDVRLAVYSNISDQSATEARHAETARLQALYLGGGDCGVPEIRCYRAPGSPVRSGTECDVRHHNHPEGRDPESSAPGHFPASGWTKPYQFPAGWLWNLGKQASNLAACARFRSDHVAGDLRYRRT